MSTNNFFNRIKGGATDETVVGSRLLNNTETLRNVLITRNLYTPNNAYPLSPNEASKIINTIDSIIDIVSPFKGFDLSNTVMDRLIGDDTPLSRIGLTMAGKQLAYNQISNVTAEVYEMIKPSNLFDGNKDTKLFVKNSDFSITSKIKKTTIGQILANLTTRDNWKRSPFSSESTYDEYLENTGSGQLDLMFKSLNRNLYTSNDPTLKKYSLKTDNPMNRKYSLIGPTYFNFSKDQYLGIKINPDSEFKANVSMRVAYDNATNNNTTNEYAPNLDYINENLGSTITCEGDVDISNISDSTDTYMNSWINNETGFLTENVYDRIVWGRDSVEDVADKNLDPLRGLSNKQNDNVIPRDIEKDFNASIGLIKYTSELLNATDGNLIDITRKAFKKSDKLVGFNGSGLWKAPSHSLSRFAKNATGVRQHTILDQYDRYAKAIRYDGNKVDGSVIRETVMPKIHPIYKDDKYSSNGNKDMMFSIENLAYYITSSDENTGQAMLENGSYIPISELGPTKGRIMWFPPYNIEINETTVAKYDSTVMVGRGEPIYSYQNSERSANLNFTLLIDYPPQLRDGLYSGGDKHKAISEFFAFGLDSNINNANTNNEILKLKELEAQLKSITEEEPILSDNSLGVTLKEISFPNDMPNTEEIPNVFDLMYGNGYEVSEVCLPTDGTSFGINKTIYSNAPLLDNPNFTPQSIFSKIVDPNSIGQYEFVGDDCKLNANLKRIYADVDNRENYVINIIGSASKLYEIKSQEAAYNQALGLRRAEATKILINKRLDKMFPNHGVVITTISSVGSTNSGDSTGLVENISTRETKDSRNVTIIFSFKGTTKTKKRKLTQDDEANIKKIKDEIELVNTNLKSKEITNINENNLRESGISNADSKLITGFDAISRNVYVPVFHSQTPEEFHRRLVFLQQCMRQGNAQESVGKKSIKNSVFGRQPICILRVGDFLHTKVIIENLNIDYSETTWDMNPEGFGMQPMIAKVTLQLKVIGGQSLKGPIDALQNAISFNHYANSTFSNKGIYKKPFDVQTTQYGNKTIKDDTTIIVNNE
jgi:hypothetical protein